MNKGRGSRGIERWKGKMMGLGGRERGGGDINSNADDDDDNDAWVEK